MGASNSSIDSRESGLVLAADLEDLRELKSLAEMALPHVEVAAIKVGFSLALRFGLPRVVEAIRAVSELPIIYDHQKAGTDIPQMGPRFADLCATVGVDSIILFPQAGPATLTSFVRAALASEIRPIVGAVMTHPEYLLSEGGFIADDAPRRICELALNLGVADFVLPGNKAELTQRLVRESFSGALGMRVYMPGIGAQGGELSAAMKAARPTRAFPIIGSAIYRDANPQAALAKFCADFRGLARNKAASVRA